MNSQFLNIKGDDSGNDHNLISVLKKYFREIFKDDNLNKIKFSLTKIGRKDLIILSQLTEYNDDF